MRLPDKYSDAVELAGGKNASVFRARNRNVGRDCFLKAYPAPENDPRSALKEPQLLQALRHRHLVEIYDADVLDAEHVLLEMEWLPAGSFQNLIDVCKNKGEWIEVRKAIELVCDVADGLNHFHRAGFVHRDIKPANLMLKESAAGPVGIVTDLGLASQLDSATGRAAGSQHSRLYRPQEAWEGKRCVPIRCCIVSVTGGPSPVRA